MQVLYNLYAISEGYSNWAELWKSICTNIGQMDYHTLRVAKYIQSKLIKK